MRGAFFCSGCLSHRSTREYMSFAASIDFWTTFAEDVDIAAGRSTRQMKAGERADFGAGQAR